jgi:hypothetical protein
MPLLKETNSTHRAFHEPKHRNVNATDETVQQFVLGK